MRLFYSLHCNALYICVNILNVVQTLIRHLHFMILSKTKQRYIEQLKEFLSIPSISADSRFLKEVERAAHWVKKTLIDSGCTQVKVYPTEGHPIVFGSRIIDPKLPTVMVYGHYDVQPPDPLDQWETEPFRPIIKKTKIHPQGALFARGACDDKGQLMIHVKAFEELVNQDNLNCNVSFLIEGEEEVGSNHLEQFLKEYKQELASDVVLISDTAIISNSQPSITSGLRGLCYFEVKVKGSSIDLHSGVYGGAVPNPLTVLCELMAKLHDRNRKIIIPGFYDDVILIDEESKAEINKEILDLQEFKDSIGIKNIMGEKDYTTVERKSIRPALDINGIYGGYTLEGTKTVIPSEATAKVSMRLVPNQNWKKISSLFSNHIKKLAPDSVSVSVKIFQGGNPYLVSKEHIGFKAAHSAYSDSFGISPIATRGGGSIPIVSNIEEILGAKSILMGFGLDSDAIHSPNEHFGLFNFFKGIETVKQFYSHYAQLTTP